MLPIPNYDHTKTSFSTFLVNFICGKNLNICRGILHSEILTCVFVSGRDFIHQMKLIVGILGTPPKEVLKLSHSDMVTKFIKGTGCYWPE